MRDRVVVSTFVVIAALATPATALAHGTSEPGPHGGEIRMPGAFHVEAIAGDDALRIYVLDMQFDNPTVDNAELAAKIEYGGSTTQLECAPADDAKVFICPLPPDTRLDRGRLVVDASRQGRPGEAAEYDLPLEWSGE